MKKVSFTGNLLLSVMLTVPFFQITIAAAIDEGIGEEPSIVGSRELQLEKKNNVNLRQEEQEGNRCNQQSITGSEERINDIGATYLNQLWEKNLRDLSQKAPILSSYFKRKGDCFMNSIVNLLKVQPTKSLNLLEKAGILYHGGFPVIMNNILRPFLEQNKFDDFFNFLPAVEGSDEFLIFSFCFLGETAFLSYDLSSLLDITMKICSNTKFIQMMMKYPSVIGTYAGALYRLVERKIVESGPLLVNDLLLKCSMQTQQDVLLNAMQGLYTISYYFSSPLKIISYFKNCYIRFIGAYNSTSNDILLL